jgi:phage terminase small subunit
VEGAGVARRLTKKQRVFIEEYLQCWNASEAARRAGYSERSARVTASKLLTKANIQAEISERISEKAMTADEILVRLGDMARGDLGDFMDIENMTFHLSLKKAKELGLTHLIKKVKQRTTIRQKKDGDEEEEHWIELELHDAKDALVHLGKHHKLFTDKFDLTSGGKSFFDIEAWKEDRQSRIDNIDDMEEQECGTQDT